MPTKEHAQKIFSLLKSHYPHAKMILEWDNNFELLVAIILSAQCTDKKVNEVTDRLFPKYLQKRREFEKLYKQYEQSVILSKAKDPYTNKQDSGQTRMTTEQIIQLVNFSEVSLSELEQDIKSTGFYHNKAKSVQNAAKVILDKFHGILPRTIAELTTIPGVGRKTANVFLTNAYHIDEGIAVDTHVKKQAFSLGLTKNTDPNKIEQDLMQLFPQSQWHQLTYMLIEHGRNLRRKKSDRETCGEKDCILCNIK